MGKLIAVVLGLLLILFLYLRLIMFIVQTFPIVSVVLLPVFLYFFYDEARKMIRRYNSDPDFTDYDEMPSIRLYITKLILLAIGFPIMLFGMINISESVAFIVICIAMLLGMYRMMEIGEDIKRNGISHTD